MTIIQMDLEVIENLIQRMNIFAGSIKSREDGLRSSVLHLDWSGNSREDFVSQLFSVNGKISQLLEEINALALKLRAEKREWEEEASKFGHGSLFITGINELIPIHPSDVDQGALGDCYLMAAMGAVASSDPTIIQDMLHENPDGSFTVRFFNETTGEAEYVIVRKEDLPLDSLGNPLYAQLGDSGELWSAIIEKGYAQWIDERNIKDPLWSKALELFGFDGKDEYKLIEGGMSSTAMQHITGRPSSIFSPANSLSEKNLIANLTNGKCVTFSSLRPDAAASNPLYINDTLCSKHAYFVTGYDSVTGMVEVRNPWGWTHEHGLSYIPLSELQESVRYFAVN